MIYVENDASVSIDTFGKTFTISTSKKWDLIFKFIWTSKLNKSHLSKKKCVWRKFIPPPPEVWLILLLKYDGL